MYTGNFIPSHTWQINATKIASNTGNDKYIILEIGMRWDFLYSGGVSILQLESENYDN